MHFPFPYVTQSPDVMMCRFADTVDVFFERQRFVDRDAKTSHAARNRDGYVAECDSADLTLNSLSSTGADDDYLRFVGVSDKPFNENQCCTAWKQLSMVAVALVTLSEMYSCVSSAYCAWFTPNEAMMLAVGAT